MQSQLRMAGIDYHKAGAAIRERFSFPGSLHDAYRFFAETIGSGNLDKDQGVILLSTCNRTELWISGALPSTPFELLCSLKGLDPREYELYALFLEGPAAVRHLFRTAGGFESLIKGERQILGQIRDAMEMARQWDCAGTVLDRLFQSALACAKKIKTETGLNRGNPSAAYRAVSVIRDRYPPRSGVSALVIGNGAVGGACARSLREAGFPVSVTVRKHKEREVLVPPGCDPIPYEDRYGAIDRHKVIISATVSPHHTIAFDELEKRWDGKDRLFLDLAMPRDMDEAITGLPGLTLLNLDDLGDSGELPRENEQAAKILDEGVEAFHDWLEFRKTRRKEHVYFPLFMNISEKTVLVIGGGHIALRRVRKLIPFHCTIRVLAPHICDELGKLAEEAPETITLIRDPYCPGVCAGADLVLAATNDRGEESDFFFPALIMEDNLIIGVISSTGNHKQVKNAAEKISGVFKK